MGALGTTYIHVPHVKAGYWTLRARQSRVFDSTPGSSFFGGGGRDPTPGTSLFSDPPRAELFRMLTPFPPSPFLPRERVCHPPIPPYPWIEFIFGRWIPSSHHNHGETTSTPFFQLYKKQYPISLQSLALQDSSLRHLLSSLGKVWGTGGGGRTLPFFWHSSRKNGGWGRRRVHTFPWPSWLYLTLSHGRDHEEKKTTVHNLWRGERELFLKRLFKKKTSTSVFLARRIR